MAFRFGDGHGRFSLVWLLEFGRHGRVRDRDGATDQPCWGHGMAQRLSGMMMLCYRCGFGEFIARLALVTRRRRRGRREPNATPTPP